MDFNNVRLKPDGQVLWRRSHFFWYVADVRQGEDGGWVYTVRATGVTGRRRTRDGAVRAACRAAEPHLLAIEHSAERRYHRVSGLERG